VRSVWATYWLPESVSNTELVACFEVKKIGVSECSYEDGKSIKRYVRQVEIDINAANTGELIETFALMGPRSGCPKEKVADADYSDETGVPLLEKRSLRTYARS